MSHKSEEIKIMKKDHELKDEEKTLESYNEVENVDRNYILIESPNEFTSNPYEKDNDTSINTIGFESVNSEMTSTTTPSLNNELTNNQLIVLEPNNPVMVRFQITLKQHLLKQRDSIKQELLTLDGQIRLKQNERSSFINDLNNIDCRVNTQHNLLSEFHKIKTKLGTVKEQIESSIDQGKQRCSEIVQKTTVETKKFSVLKRQLECSQGLLKELIKYEKEQEITFNMCNQKKSQTKQYKKKLLSEQQKQDLLLLSLTQEILRLEDRMKQLGDQAETKFNERELLKQKVMDSSTDLDAIIEDNAKITLLWNEVLISIHQRDKSFQKTKNDFQEAKDKYHSLLMEANSYKRSAQEELKRNNDLLNFLKKSKQEQTNIQNNFKTCLDKLNYLKEEYSKLIQMTEFQNQNLDQIVFDQKLIKNEINMLVHSLQQKSNRKLTLEEDILDELKKQLFTNNHCVQINNKISELKVQSKKQELIFVEFENNLSRSLLKLEQCRASSLNLEKDVEVNTKYLNDKAVVISKLNSEQKKLYDEIKKKSRQIDLEKKQLETVKRRSIEGYNITPQMQIDQVRFNINEVEKETDFIKQLWVQSQNKNVQLLDQRNVQFNELNKIRKYALVMVTKNIKLEQEIISLHKEVDQYKRTLTNIRNTILKLNENFSQNKGKSCQLLNENEWMQCSYFSELKENEKQCFDYMDQLKLFKNELNEMKNVYIEKQRESRSWDTKVQLLVEIKKEIKKKEGDFGDIDSMKNEIHRMQIRKSQLKKILEKIMLDLEACISRREMIYNKVAAKDIRLKGKNETKQKFLKKLDDLRIDIKKIKIECKKLDRNINDLQLDKLEIENKLSYLNDRLIQVQKNINDLTRDIENISATKIKNIHNLSYKQNYSKFLDKVKKGKYRLLIKTESRMNEDYATEWKRNSDLISVVEALKNDFPYMDFQIIRLLNILKAIKM